VVRWYSATDQYTTHFRTNHSATIHPRSSYVFTFWYSCSTGLLCWVCRLLWPYLDAELPSDWVVERVEFVEVREGKGTRFPGELLCTSGCGAIKV
jgi:hypothetical protein